jgi:hypothetical protein
VARQQIDWRPLRESLIEIGDIEAASVGHAADRGKSSGSIYGNRGDIDAKDVHSTLGQPYRHPPLATSHLQGVSSPGEVVLEGGEDLRETWRTE